MFVDKQFEACMTPVHMHAILKGRILTYVHSLHTLVCNTFIDRHANTITY
jgi:hypothetical protein